MIHMEGVGSGYRVKLVTVTGAAVGGTAVGGNHALDRLTNRIDRALRGVAVFIMTGGTSTDTVLAAGAVMLNENVVPSSQLSA